VSFNGVWLTAPIISNYIVKPQSFLLVGSGVRKPCNVKKTSQLPLGLLQFIHRYMIVSHERQANVFESTLIFLNPAA
jgi:hypothetical protein